MHAEKADARHTEQVVSALTHKLVSLEHKYAAFVSQFADLIGDHAQWKTEETDEARAKRLAQGPQTERTDKFVSDLHQQVDAVETALLSTSKHHKHKIRSLFQALRECLDNVRTGALLKLIQELTDEKVAQASRHREAEKHLTAEFKKEVQRYSREIEKVLRENKRLKDKAVLLRNARETTDLRPTDDLKLQLRSKAKVIDKQERALRKLTDDLDTARLELKRLKAFKKSAKKKPDQLPQSHFLLTRRLITELEQGGCPAHLRSLLAKLHSLQTAYECDPTNTTESAGRLTIETLRDEEFHELRQALALKERRVEELTAANRANKEALAYAVKETANAMETQLLHIFKSQGLLEQKLVRFQQGFGQRLRENLDIIALMNDSLENALQHKDTFETLREENEHLKFTLQQKQSLFERQVADYMKTIDFLTAENEGLTEQLQDAIEQNRQLDAYAQTCREVQEQGTIYKEMQAENDALVSEVAKVRASLEAKQFELEHLQCEKGIAEDNLSDLEKQCNELQRECWNQQKEYQASLKEYEAKLEAASIVDPSQLKGVLDAVAALKTHLPLVESEVKAYALTFIDNCKQLLRTLQNCGTSPTEELEDARQTIQILKQSLDQAEREKEQLQAEAVPDSDKVKKLKEKKQELKAKKKELKEEVKKLKDRLALYDPEAIALRVKADCDLCYAERIRELEATISRLQSEKHPDEIALSDIEVDPAFEEHSLDYSGDSLEGAEHVVKELKAKAQVKLAEKKARIAELEQEVKTLRSRLDTEILFDQVKAAVLSLFRHVPAMSSEVESMLAVVLDLLAFTPYETQLLSKARAQAE